ncbi:inositol-pentakisphosphate 2-kinase [Cunninghamella echinulata]|nr:inositol-pentakisphosphate 2-kinase [Cunninghamella echinulata]
MIFLTQRDALDWTYLAEGNANLVLKYIGKDPQLMGRVLRLAKLKTTDNKDKQSSQDFNEQFSKHIIGKLVGPHYISDTIQIQVDESFITLVESNLQENRCIKRRKDHLQRQPTAFLMKDLTLSFTPNGTWTFEIKPKWGFLPNSKWIDKQHQQLKMEKCRFCMHQRLRNKKHDSTRKNKKDEDEMEGYYCPLDLYSGDPHRMKRALRTSLTIPHSYLKLFYNGQPANSLSERYNYLHLLLPHLETATLISQVTDLLVTILLKDPILQRLKQLQRSLDALDIEGIFPIYQKYTNEDSNDIQSTCYDIDFWRSILENFLIRLTNNSETVNPSLVDHDIQRIYEYLLSMTLKDCSIMISISPTTTTATATDNGKNNNNSLENKIITINSDEHDHQGYHYFNYDIKLVDVDMKKWNKIPYWFELDRQIIDYNLQIPCDRKCLDSIL